MCLEFNGSCRNLRIIGILVAVLHQSFHGDALFLHNTVKKARVAQNDLHHAVHIPKIDKGHAAMITDIFDPAGQTQRFSHVCLADLIQLTVPISF